MGIDEKAIKRLENLRDAYNETMFSPYARKKWKADFEDLHKVLLKSISDFTSTIINNYLKESDFIFCPSISNVRNFEFKIMGSDQLTVVYENWDDHIRLDTNWYTVSFGGFDGFSCELMICSFRSLIRMKAAFVKHSKRKVA